VTIAATLAVNARAEGMRARLQMVFATPMVEIDGAIHSLRWLTTHRFVIAPGRHTVRMFFKRHQSTGGHATSVFTCGPTETVHLVATLTGTRFVNEVSHSRPRPLDAPV